MADYAFYTGTYLGNSVPEGDFARVAARAQAQLDCFSRIYQVEGDETACNLAVCAMADAIYYYEAAANGSLAESVSVGSVSSSIKLPDTSPAAQAAELLRCVRQYLRLYRGCG